MAKLRCPSCYSPELVQSRLRGNSYTCKQCGYPGRFVIELEDETVLPLLEKYNKHHSQKTEAPQPSLREKRMVILGVLLFFIILIVTKFHLFRYIQT